MKSEWYMKNKKYNETNEDLPNQILISRKSVRAPRLVHNQINKTGGVWKNFLKK